LWLLGEGDEERACWRAYLWGWRERLELTTEGFVCAFLRDHFPRACRTQKTRSEQPDAVRLRKFTSISSPAIALAAVGTPSAFAVDTQSAVAVSAQLCFRRG
jgi:hypothetical protein